KVAPTCDGLVAVKHLGRVIAGFEEEFSRPAEVPSRPRPSIIRRPVMNDCFPLPPSLGQATFPGASAAEPRATALRIWTLGHSTRSLKQLIELLQHYGVHALADVRRHPGSRRLPQFGQQALAQGL